MEQALLYCRVNKLPLQIAAVLDNINKAHWPLFVQGKKEEEKLIITTGYYNGSGRFAQKVILTGVVIKAVIKSGFEFKYKNVSPRGGAAGERVEILYTKTHERYND